MPCIKALLLSTLQLAATFLPSHNNISQTTDNHTRFPHVVDVTITGTLQENLESLPEASIHAALEQVLPIFKPGMFEHDSSAIEAVHRSNPPLATKLLAAARYDLLRRQNGNLTTTVNNPPAVLIPIALTSTNSAGSLVVSTATALSVATVSVEQAVSTTDAKGSVSIKTVTVPGMIVTNANGQITTSAGPTVNSNGLVEITSTNAQGSTVVATVTPSAGLISSVVLLTTTLPDGTRQTFTSFAMIPVASSTNGPKLQSSGPVVRPISIRGLVVALVAFGALLL